jgi:hypothetical protein
LSEEEADDEHVGSETRAGEEGDGVQQIIYVTYQVPDDPSEARTLHIVDDIEADGDTVVSWLYIYIKGRNCVFWCSYYVIGDRY